MILPAFLPRRKKRNLICIRRVVGESMIPTLRPGQIVVALGFMPLRVGAIVIADIAGREVIKRVAAIDDVSATLLGDNESASTDSREYGPIKISLIHGRVIFVH